MAFKNETYRFIYRPVINYMNFSLFQEVGQKEVEIRKRSRKKKNFNYLKSTVISTSCANLQLVLLKVEGYFLPSGEISVKFREISLKMKSRSSIYNSFSCKIWPVRVVNMRKYCIDHFALGYGADKILHCATNLSYTIYIGYLSLNFIYDGWQQNNTCKPNWDPD